MALSDKPLSLLPSDGPLVLILHLQIQVGPYCEKTDSKPNTVQKRFSDFKKKYGLNISTTATLSDNSKIAPAKPRKPRAPRASKTNGNNQPEPKVKRETSAEETKAQAPEESDAEIKVEGYDMTTANGLPSPANSSIDSTRNVGASQISSFMPQKRSLDESNGYHYANTDGKVIKKARAAEWAF